MRQCRKCKTWWPWFHSFDTYKDCICDDYSCDTPEATQQRLRIEYSKMVSSIIEDLVLRVEDLEKKK